MIFKYDFKAKTDSTTETVSEDKNKVFFSFENLFAKFSNSFSILIGLSSTVYALGFLMWSLYAWDNGLGFLPVIREQNLVAGILPLLIILVIYLIIANTPKTIVKLFSWIAKGSKIKGLKGLLLILMIAGIFVLIFLNAYAKYSVPIMFTSALLYIVLSGNKEEVDRITRSATGYVKLASGFGSLILLSFYIGVVFPGIPQDLGGPKPCLVQLDIVRENISSQTQKAIFQNEQFADTQSILRTGNLYLLFDGNDYLLLRKSLTRKDSSYSLLKIKRESVKGIFEPTFSK